MAMKRCPVCGEKYSDTYRSCPFCEEEEALRQGGQIRRAGGRGGRGGKRAAGGSQPNLLSPILIVIIVLLACLLIYLLFGDKIADKLGGDKDPVTPPPVEDVTTPPADDQQEPEEGVMPGGETDPAEPEPTAPTTPTVDPANLPATLKVNNPDFTLKVGDTYTVKVTEGGSGPFTWLSSDDGVVSVDENGKVTAISVGKVTLTVHDGAGKGSVTVYVKAADNGATSQGPTPTTPSGGENKLNKTDFTLPVGDPDVQLTVSGITTAVTWTSKDPSVATVSATGLVKAVSKGTTTVTASWDGHSLECIVRVR